MRIAILTIGNELLSGKTINTNANWLSKKLSSIGSVITLHITIPDEQESIINNLDLLFSTQIDLIICTGGLGVTDDDITRDVIFSYFGSNEVFDKDYWAFLENKFLKFGYSLPDSNKSQAVSPDNGKVFSNPIGSARGLIYEKNNITYYTFNATNCSRCIFK